jgi:hypothetical protein
MIPSSTGFSLCGFDLGLARVVESRTQLKSTQAEACATEGLKLQGWLEHPMQGAK